MLVIASADSQALDRWREWFGAHTVLEIRSLDALPDCVMNLHPKLVLLDIRLQRPGLVRHLAQLLKVCPETCVVVLAQDCSEEMELALFRAGVRGVCALAIGQEMLSKVANAVLAGELWIRRSLVPKLLDSIASEPANASGGTTGRFANLTPREVEITHLIAKGESNKHIARYLAITERTVKNHLTAIFRKIGVVDRVKLAVLAARSAERSH
jgi:DNA-binding NarL/FixJ family response regulator